MKISWLAFASASTAACVANAQLITNFIGRQGATLVELSDDNTPVNGSSPWRYAGMNMYWLGLDENCSPPQTGKCLAYPSKFRIEDALTTAAALGANVVRAHTLGVSTGNEDSFQQEAGSTTFNTAALDSVDYAVYQASLRGIRFIVPLTDNYNYYHGGYHDFTDYQASKASHAPTCNPFPKRVVKPDDGCRSFFDHDPANTHGLGNATIAGFKAYISTLLNHKNQYTGNLLKDEPAILAWETGNELFIKGEPFTNWTSEIATFMKHEVGIKQLVMDGRANVGAGVDDEALSTESDVDIFTDHYYKAYDAATSTLEKDAQITAVQYGKVFVVGEYGPKGAKSLEDLKGFTSKVETLTGSNADTGDSFPLVAGDTWWSFFGHGDNYGFVPHPDGYTLHFPGDDDTDMATIMALRDHANTMRGSGTSGDVYSGSDTPPPTIAPVINSHDVSQAGQDTVYWRGATLANKYDVQYLENASDPDSWKQLCSACVTDHDMPYTISLNDGPVCTGASSSFVIRARGLSVQGQAGPWSNATNICSLPKLDQSAVLVAQDDGFVRRPLF